MEINSPIRLQNERCALEFSLAQDKASAWCVSLRDKKTDLVREGGLCEVEVMWSPLQRFEIQNDLTLPRAVQLSETQLRFAFLAPGSCIEFEMLVTLEDSEFTVCIPWHSIREPRASRAARSWSSATTPTAAT